MHSPTNLLRYIRGGELRKVAVGQDSRVIAPFILSLLRPPRFQFLLLAVSLNENCSQDKRTPRPE